MLGNHLHRFETLGANFYSPLHDVTLVVGGPQLLKVRPRLVSMRTLNMFQYMPHRKCDSEWGSEGEDLPRV